MKIRNSFVSNSSSSSFIIGSRDNYIDDEKLFKAIFKDISEDSNLYHLARAATQKISEYAEKIDNPKEHWFETPDICEKILKKEMNIFEANLDDYSPWRYALCQMEVHYEDDELIIEKCKNYK